METSTLTVRCHECGKAGIWLGHSPSGIWSTRWFEPNEHDDGIVDICNECWER